MGRFNFNLVQVTETTIKIFIFTGQLDIRP